MTNSPKLADALNKQCKGTNGVCSRPKGGNHVHLTGGHARRAAKYPQDLCHAVIQGMHSQLEADGHLVPGYVGFIAREDPVMSTEAAQKDTKFSGRFMDATTGQVL